MRSRVARLLAERGRLRRVVGERWSELGNHVVEAWFMVTAKPRAGVAKCVRAVLDFSRRR